MSNLRSKSYGDQIQEQGLDTLEERRKRGDLLMAYRVFSGKDNMDPSTWFKNFGPGEGVVTRRQGGHLNVETPQWRGEVRRNFWSVRVTELWNSLPDGVKKVETLNAFKNSVDNLRG